MVADNSKFPAPAYRDTVLAPLFDGTKNHFWGELMRLHRAHGVMLAEQEICTATEISQILKALADIEARIEPENLVYDGNVEDVFFLVEQELAGRLGIDLAGKLHTGRSRNDMDHTIFKLRLKRHLDDVVGSLLSVLDTLLSVAARNQTTIIIAYTHGQPAQPSTFAHYLGAFIEVLLRDIERLTLARQQVDRCSMGAAAITTTGFDINRERVAELLGFAAAQENSYGCIAACDYVTASYAALKVMFINIGRFIQDMNQWTGFEVSQLTVPDAYVQISSIMPQKRNPVPVEHLRLIASLGAGHCDTITNTMHNTPFTDMNDSEGEVQISGYQAFAAAKRLLRLLAGFIDAVQINDEKVRTHIDQACITITELADTLVRTEDISFRQAHAVSATLANQIVGCGKTLSTVPFSTFVAAYQDSLGRAPSLTEETFRRAITPEHFVSVRERLGGPGPKAIAASLSRYRAALDGFREALRSGVATMTAADALLDRRVRDYLPASAQN